MPQSTILFELIDLRTETTKTFRLEDGSYYVAQYDTAIHYPDADGVWQDIDNTLTARGSEISTSNARIKFAKKTAGNDTIFTIHDGNRKLTLALNGAEKKVPGRITNHQTEFGEDATQLQKMTTLDKVAASVKYEDILDGVDLEYVVNGRDIKENIIVKEKLDSYVYSFAMSLNNLTAVRNDAGEIVISDAASGEAVYLIPAAFMYDANDSGSSAVTTELTDHGNGKYTITISADSSWINADDRAFPVTIDPPIYTEPSSSSVTDIYMPTSGTSTTNSTSLYVGSTWRSYWKLNTLPSLPKSAYITNATFTAACHTTAAFMHGYVAVYDVMTNWDSTLNWSKVTAVTNPQGVPAENYTDFQMLYCYEEYGTYYNNYLTKDPCWNITPIVKKWYSGENYGLTMAPAVGTTFTGTAMFRSSTYSDSAKRPRLSITYRDMKGLEDYWSYSSQSAGFAGTGSVNNATGNLVLTIPTLTSTDALMPFTPALVYNSALASMNYAFSNAQTAFSSTYMPLGFKLNINETLIKKSYTDETDAVKYLCSDHAAVLQLSAERRV